MYRLSLEKKCGCAKKDPTLDEKLAQTFNDKKEAEFAALKLVNHMNASWCKKHRFYVNEEGEEMQIIMEMSCPNEPK